MSGSPTVNRCVDCETAEPSAIPSRVSVEEGYSRWAATYDHAPNPLLALEQRCLPLLLTKVAGKRVLDLACGTGRWLETLSALGSAAAIGIDLSAAMLAVARKKQPVAGRLVQADCLYLPFEDAFFDMAVCSFALEHIEKLDQLAAEWGRVLLQPADLFITELHPRAYAAGWRTGFRDQQGAMQIDNAPHSEEEMISAFRGAGFEILQAQECFIGEPERSIFAMAGKEQSFDAARVVPAILILHFRRCSAASDN